MPLTSTPHSEKCQCCIEDAQLQEEEETLTLDFYLPFFDITASKDLNEETVFIIHSVPVSLYFVCCCVFSSVSHYSPYMYCV